MKGQVEIPALFQFAALKWFDNTYAYYFTFVFSIP